MKQFIVVLMGELGEIDLNDIRLIPAEDKNEAVQKYCDIPRFQNAKNGSSIAVIGYVEFEDGYPCPKFDHDILMNRTFAVRPSAYMENKKNFKAEEKTAKEEPEGKKCSCNCEEKEGCSNNKTYIVGVHNRSNDTKLSLLPFTPGTCMVISAKSSEDACYQYSLEASNYIGTSPIISIEIINGNNLIVTDEYGFVKNNPLVAFALVQNGKTQEVYDIKSILFPKCLSIVIFDTSFGYDFYRYCADITQGVYIDFLNKAGLLDEFRKKDVRIGTLLVEGDYLWLRR